MPAGPHRSHTMTRAWTELSRWAKNASNRPQDSHKRLERAFEPDRRPARLGHLVVDLWRIEAVTTSLRAPWQAAGPVKGTLRRATANQLAAAPLDYPLVRCESSKAGIAPCRRAN